MLTFLNNLLDVYIDMAPYMVMGLLFVGLLHTFVPKERLLQLLGRNSAGSVVKAAMIGVPLPLCSCGVVPTAIELKKSGASDGAVLSFLTSTPQTGIDSIIATWGMMGPFMAVYRAVAAFLSGIITGLTANRFSKHEPIISEAPTCSCHGHDSHDHAGRPPLREILTYPFGGFMDELAGHFLIGVVVAAAITTLIPDDFFLRFGLGTGLPSLLLMLVIGIPMYICSTSSIPVAAAFLLKGVSPGAAFVFLFAGPVTNAASLILLRSTLGKRLTALYVACVTGTALLFGGLCNWLVGKFQIDILSLTGGHMAHRSVFSLVVAGVFLLLLIKGLIVTLRRRFRQEAPVCSSCDHDHTHDTSCACEHTHEETSCSCDHTAVPDPACSCHK